MKFSTAALALLAMIANDCLINLGEVETEVKLMKFGVGRKR